MGQLRAQLLDLHGVTALRTVTTNLNGAGIRVAQPEVTNPDDGTNNWEVNPASVGRSLSVFSYASADGTSTTYPNALGGASSHAAAVANNFYGMPNGVATNAAHVDSWEVNYFYDNYITSPSLPNLGDPVVNQSYSFGPLVAATQQTVDSDYDDYAAQNKVLFISGAYNGGSVCAPATCYNGIGVACYQGASSIGPTIDNGRCKPDITAFGTPAGFTSFSTPFVAGVATLLMQAALRGDGGADTNSAFDFRTVKALLLNGAVKPADWTNSSASPLDARHGAGVVNALNSYVQLAGGKRNAIVSNTVSLNAVHPPTGATGTVVSLSGWNFATNASSASTDCIHHYYFDVTNVAPVKFSAAATLVWMRQKNKTSINNLNLFLYNTANSNLVLCSTSLVDNVEHITTTNLAQGRYDLQVWKAGGVGIVSTAEPYALAWEFVPPPKLAISNTVGRTLTWPVYPAGFQVEARTNLLLGAWSTNGFSALAVTNGVNNIPLNTSNAAQFFRLRKPNL